MGTFLNDVGFALRSLRKSPGFTCAAVLTLALGIGASTAIFTGIDALLLRPLPLPQPDRIVMLWAVNPIAGYDHANVSYLDFRDWKESAASFASLGAYQEAGFTLSGRGEPEVLAGAQVTADFFPALGVAPGVGRGFLPEDDRPGAARVAVLSHEVWARRFAADPAILGQVIMLDARPVTVVGVLPRSFQVPGSEFMQAWTNLAPEVGAVLRGNRAFKAIGRLKAGVSLPRAQAEMDGLATRLAATYAPTNINVGVKLVRLSEEIFDPGFRLALEVLFFAVGLVLLIGCANIANLLLARGLAREKEVAVRTAVGASRGRLVRQLLTESLTLAFLGGALGLVLSVWGVAVFVRLLPPDTSRLSEVHVDQGVLAFGLLASLASALVFGLAPALSASRGSVSEALKESAPRSGLAPRHARLQGILVVGEVALAVGLLALAGLLGKSLVHLRHVDTGLRAEGVVTMAMNLPEAEYAGPSEIAGFFDRALPLIARLPGVARVGAVSTLPMGGSNSWTNVSFEGQDAVPLGHEARTGQQVVTPDYFAALGIPLREGRAFAAADDASHPQVAMVNETFAKKYWPGQSAVGKRLKPGRPDSKRPWREVVGVAGDVRHQGVARALRPELYEPQAQNPQRDMFLVVQAGGAPLGLVPAIRREIRTAGPNQAVTQVMTMAEVAQQGTAPAALFTGLLGAFAVTALLLSVIGLYGVVSFAVGQRTREIGIRVALGAQSGDLVALVLKRWMGLALAGVALGLAGALAAGRILSSLLFDVRPHDAASLGGAAAILLLVALIASLVPARRVLKVDPILALR